MIQRTKPFSLSVCAVAAGLLVSACGSGDAEPPPDRFPPTVTITDNVPAATATGPVTFTFTFSEDVGASFVADDVVVAGGAKGAFVMGADGKSATLVVTPAANTSATIEVNVAAGKFTDLAGNTNTAAATVTQPYNTVVDTTPPTVAITDNEAGATATGPVTFAFTFSEDVGTSFELSDIVVTGGSAGTLTKVSQTQYNLIVTPAANTTGTLGVSVAAGKFVDLAGIANTAGATASQAFDTAAPPPAAGTLLLSFDENPPAFTDMGAYGGALPDVVAGPAGGTGNALKILKPASPDTWGGVYFGVTAIPFTATRKTITARVYATKAGAVFKFKVESGNGGPAVEVAAAATGAANTWQTVSWDLSGVDVAKAYTTVAITPDQDLVTTGQSYYVDQITLAAAAAPPGGGTDCGTTAPTCAPTTVIPADAVRIYTETVSAAGFNPYPNWGQATQFSEATLAGNKSLKYTNLNYEGIEFTAVNVSAKGNVHFDFWSPDLTSVKISLISPGKENPVTQVLTTKGWNSVDIDLSQYTVPDKTGINQIKLEAAGSGTLYVDNIYFWGTATATPPGTTPNPGAAQGSAGPVTIPVLTASLFGDFAAAGDALFAGDYIGGKDSNGNSSKWDTATTNGLANNGNIGYFQDTALSNSAQKLEENGWVAGLTDNAGGVPSFFRYFILTKPASTFTNSYMGLFANAPKNGTVNVSSYGNIKFRLWGPAEMYQVPGFNPTLEMTLTGAKVAGCTSTGSGGTEIKKSFVANQKIGAASTYKLPLAAWTVVGVCGVDTNANAVASVLGALARVVVSVPGTSFNFTTANAGGTTVTYATGVNLGPIAFTNN